MKLPHSRAEVGMSEIMEMLSGVGIFFTLWSLLPVLDDITSNNLIAGFCHYTVS